MSNLAGLAHRYTYWRHRLNEDDRPETLAKLIDDGHCSLEDLEMFVTAYRDHINGESMKP